MQQQPSHTASTLLHRRTKHPTSQNIQRPLGNQQYSHRRNQRLIQQRQNRRRRCNHAHRTEGHRKGSGTAESAQARKHPCHQPCQRIDAQQLHLRKQRHADCCPADNAGNRAPLLCTHQGAQQHQHRCQQPSEGNAPKGDIAQRHHQHRRCQHHADQIGSFEGEHPLSQCKSPQAFAQKTSAGSGNRRLCQRHQQVIPLKRNRQQSRDRGQQHPTEGKQRSQCRFPAQRQLLFVPQHQPHRRHDEHRRRIFDGKAISRPQIGQVCQNQTASRTAQRSRHQTLVRHCRTQRRSKRRDFQQHISHADHKPCQRPQQGVHRLELVLHPLPQLFPKTHPDKIGSVFHAASSLCQRIDSFLLFLHQMIPSCIKIDCRLDSRISGEFWELPPGADRLFPLLRLFWIFRIKPSQIRLSRQQSRVCGRC